MIDPGGNSSNIQIDVIPQDLNDEAPGDTTSALNINLTEHPGPEPADWSTASTPLRYIATCVRDYDLLHDYTDITASISGTDASAFEIAPITSAAGYLFKMKIVHAQINMLARTFNPADRAPRL